MTPVGRLMLFARMPLTLIPVAQRAACRDTLDLPSAMQNILANALCSGLSYHLILLGVALPDVSLDVAECTSIPARALCSGLSNHDARLGVEVPGWVLLFLSSEQSLEWRVG